MSIRKYCTRPVAISIIAAFAASAPAQTVSTGQLHSTFENPPDDARIMMRWWWFGAAVEKAELERELRTMKDGGIGGVEIQPVYPLELDDPKTGFRNLPYLSEDFLISVGFAAQKARELGLRVDITLGSGWPYGGPHVPVTEAAGKLRCDRVPVPANSSSIALPDLAHGESLIAAFLARANQYERLEYSATGRLELPRNSTGTVMFFISSRTGQQVKRAAVNAEGFVLDHYDRAAIQHYLTASAGRLLEAFGANPPYAVFSDSLEVYDSDWTPDLIDEFRRRRGYDLTPFLPALAGDMGAKTADVRHDWGQTLTELAEEHYLTPLREWAAQHHTRFRSQTYGIPPVRLSSNALVDLPEGEGSRWREFSTTRWASSASHLYGRPVTSSETWTWLHSPAFRATPLDMKAEADLHFLQGINQLIGHGWPYSPPSAGEPGWRFYAAAVFNQHNPWWIVMPEIAKYLQRVSWLLRQGQPANDVALYLPTEDAWAGFTTGHDSLNQAMPALLGKEVIPRILDGGYNLDYIDDRAIDQVGIPYPVLVLPHVQHMPPATAEKIAAYKQRGGIVVQADRVSDLPRLYTPDFACGNPAVGFIHRKLNDGDVYFIANTGNQPVHTEARVRAKRDAEWWDPFSGSAYGAGPARPIPLDLEPYESRVLAFHDGAAQADPVRRTLETLDISSDWTVKFPGVSTTAGMTQLRSWTADPRTRFFSGQATYEKTVTIPAAFRRVFLNFGAGIPVAPSSSRDPGMRAWLESPVREAGLVYVNGQAAGSVWRPPYEIEITKLAHAGGNTIRVVVGNLAINSLAGQSLPDYKLLNRRYGERFTPQDMKSLEPLPAGLLGPIRLVAR